MKKISIIKDGFYNGRTYSKGQKVLVRQWLADELIEAKLGQRVFPSNTKELDIENINRIKFETAMSEIKTKEEKFNKRKTK